MNSSLCAIIALVPALAFDAENRLTSATNSSRGLTCYIYNAEGQRVRKNYSTVGSCAAPTGGTPNDYLYDLSGHLINIIGIRNEVFAGSRHLATYTFSSTYFMHADWLGTERARSNISGASYATCTSLPFGDWLTCAGGSDPSPDHFTGKQHDYESGLENFEARFDSSSMGRFMSPDWSVKPATVPYAEFGDPQSLNLYTYVRNNPLNRTDTDGHCWPFCEVMGWIATHIAQVGLQDSAVRNAYSMAAKSATSAERDALKNQARDASSPLGRALAEKAAKDPARVASRAAKTAEQLGESAGRTSPEWSAIAAKAGTVGKVSAIVAVGAAVAEVATAPENQRGQAATGAAAGAGAALLGGEMGATLGFLVGGPVGAGLGGLIGAGIGGYAGDKGGREIYNDITKPQQPSTNPESSESSPEAPN